LWNLFAAVLAHDIQVFVKWHKLFQKTITALHAVLCNVLLEHRTWSTAVVQLAVLLLSGTPGVASVWQACNCN
jgi:hypothetical protein